MIFSNLSWSPLFTEGPIQPLFVEDVTSLGITPMKYIHWKKLSGYCVYGYLREEDDQYGPKYSVRYVGEGLPKRITHKNHRVTVPNNEFIVIFKNNITKKETRKTEEELIKFYGRISRGTGILENLKHKCGGMEDPKPHKKSNCQYCEKEFAHAEFHEKSCVKNPNRERGKKILTYVSCKFCNGEYSKTQVGQHERRCKKNPDRKGISHKILQCKYCDREVLSSALPQHEKTCLLNPSRVDGPSKDKKYDKKNCKYCDRSVAGNNIAIHERSCPKNPDRVPGVRHGQKKNKDK